MFYVTCQSAFSLRRAFSCNVLFLFCSGSAVLYAQHSPFTQLTLNDGLASLEVYQVIQDSKGYVWFCSDAGISKYNGYTFKNFSIDEGLPDNNVFELREDARGRIWARTYSGNLAYIENDSVKSIKAVCKTNTNPTSLFIDKQGVVTQGFYGSGYLSCAPPYTRFKTHAPFFSGDYIVTLRDSGYIYGCAREIKPAVAGRFLSISGPLKTDTIRHSVNAGAYDSYRCLWINEGCYFISKMNVLLEVKNGKLTRQVKLSHPILHISFARRGGLWIGTKGGGAYYYRTSDPFTEKGEHYFDNDHISCVLTTRDGMTWATSTNKGVYCFYQNGPRLMDTKDGLPENELVGMERYNDTSFLIISKNANLSLISYRGNILKTIDLKHYNIHCLSYLKKIDENRLLLNSGGAFIFDLEKRTIKNLYVEKRKRTVRVAARSGNILFGAGHYSLFRYDLVTGQSMLKKVNFRINALAMQGDTMWIGCSDGLRYMHNSVIYTFGKAPSPLKKRIDAIFIKDNALYLASKGSGLTIKKGNRLITINKHNGLRGNICRSVVVDDSNTIWIATNEGIASARCANETVLAESMDDVKGLPEGGIHQLLYMKGELFAASNAGLLSLHCNTPKTPYVVPVFITSVLLNNTTLPPPRSVLDHDENHLSFEFVGLSYKNGKQTYRYKLEGLDAYYRFTSNTSVQYAALPPGKYAFVVSTAGENFQLTGQTAQFRFEITKPYWKKTWFVLCMIIFGAGVTGLFVSRKIKLEKEKAGFKARLAETELKAIRAQMNAHFIFNTINSIQNYILKNDKNTAYDYLARFSSLIRNVLENSKSEIISLEKELKTLELYMQLEALRFHEPFEYSIQISGEIKPASVFIPTMLLQPYIENAIRHGIMDKQGKGRIEIRITRKKNLLVCFIDDNGMGRENSARQNQKNSLKHKSMGMKVTAERINILHNNTDAGAGVAVIDKYDASQEALGTLVVVRIPIFTQTTSN